jgi:hypothetical protein
MISILPTSDFTSTSTITFAADGTPSGSIPIASLRGDGTASNNGATVAVSGGLATFSFGTPTDFALGLCYKPGPASLAITGALPGHTTETLLSMDCLARELMKFPEWPHWTFDGMPVLGFPNLSTNVTTAFGGSGGLGEFVIEFSAASPGAPATLTTATIGAQAG